jgi:hypothetical protein
VLDVPPFGLATSHWVLYSDGGFAGSCTVKLASGYQKTPAPRRRARSRTDVILHM